MSFTYYDFNTKKKSNDINLIFDNWQGDRETVVVYSPHDDDGFLGPGYLLTAAREAGADCYIFIYCNGCGGYSVPEQKDTIVDIRKEETLKAYRHLGIDEDHIIRFDYPDFSANTRIGWQLINGETGEAEKALKTLRKVGATRLLIPNHYREHLDHETVSIMGAYDGPQAGDPILIDWGEPSEIKTVLEYSVWSDFSPEDSLVMGRKTAIRANCGVEVDEKVEKRIRGAIREYKSQAKIIDGIVKHREERKTNNGYLEVYIKFDPRPVLDYGPYLELVKEIEQPRT